tara:strand:- start:972 stop:3206 length:2235 start_codon:yes stop_codon:yes gene_type:complete
MNPILDIVLQARAVVLALLILFCSLSISSAESTVLPEPEHLDSLIDMIEDETERQTFIEHLRTLQGINVTRTIEPTGIASVIDDISLQLGSMQNILFTQADGDSFAGLASWLRKEVETPDRYQNWLSLLAKVAVTIVFAFAIRWLVNFGLGGVRNALAGIGFSSRPVRLALLLAYGLLELIPVAAFYIAALATLTIIQPEDTVRVVGLSLVHAITFSAFLYSIMKLLLRPTMPQLRLFDIGDEDAAYILIWVSRLMVIPVYGYFLAGGAEALGMPHLGIAVLAKLFGFFQFVLIFVFILQVRRAVASWIRGDGVAIFKGLQIIRDRLADIWHIPTIVYLLVSYIVWALEVVGGFAFIARATALSIITLVVARFALFVVRQGIKRMFTIGNLLSDNFPQLEKRANAYISGVKKVSDVAIYLLAALVIAEAWSIAVFSWLTGDVGRGVISSGLEIALVVLIAVIAWETTSGFIVRYLEGYTAVDGTLVERSARARTLLPLAKNSALVVIATVATLSVLSSLGIDIGPLLAGAGVIGLAVGFGAQTLVKDVITGAFILFEDQVKVGDVAIINGQGGRVEKLTVRTIVLRDLSGNVHIVPFSAVGTLTNMTKEYSRYVLDVGVAYQEDTDEVVEVLRGIDTEMRADPEYADKIISPLEIMGVDRFEDSAVIIRARLTTEPIEQWSVGREFNRRMKKRFDEVGIEMPFPHQTVYFGVDKDGKAPPARIELEARTASGESVTDSLSNKTS